MQKIIRGQVMESRLRYLRDYQTEYQLILLGDFALSAQALTIDKRNWGEDCQKRMKF